MSNAKHAVSFAAIFIIATLVLGTFTFFITSAQQGGITGAAILSAGGNLSCQVQAGACSAGYTNILGLSNYTNAHAEYANQSNYGYSLCCTDTSSKNTITINTNGTRILNISNFTNAHVELPNQTNYSTPIFIGASASEIVCTYNGSASGICQSGNACLATLSNDTNAHIASCNTDPYATSICCSLVGANTTYLKPTTSTQAILVANGSINGTLSNNTVSYETQNITFINATSGRKYISFTAFFNTSNVTLERINITGDDNRVVTNTTNVENISLRHNLYLPNTNFGAGVRVCQNATELAHVNSTCSAAMSFNGTATQITNGITVSLVGDHYEISNLASSGAQLLIGINITSPANATSVSSSFNITDNVTAADLDYVVYEIRNTTGNVTEWTNQTNKTAIQWTSEINITNLADGTYTIVKNATDSARNTTIVTLDFTIDRTTPAPSSSGGEASGGGGSSGSSKSGIGGAPTPSATKEHPVLTAEAIEDIKGALVVEYEPFQTLAELSEEQKKAEATLARPERVVVVRLRNQGTKIIKNIEIDIESTSYELLPLYLAKFLKPKVGALKVDGNNVDTKPLEAALSHPVMIEALNPGEAISIPISIKVPFTAAESTELSILFKTQNQEIHRETATVELVPKVGATFVQQNADNTLDLYVILAAPASDNQEEHSRLSIEMDLQRPPTYDYRPTLKIRGLWEALLRGPRSEFIELLGPYDIKQNDKLVLGQRFRYEPWLEGTYNLNLQVNKGTEKIITQNHEVVLKNTEKTERGE